MRKRHSNILPFSGTIPRCLRKVPPLPTRWRWEKTVASPTQPLRISAGDNPQWHQLPWWLILSPALFWAVIIYLVNQYRTNKRRRDIADLRSRYGELTRLNTMGELAAGIVHELNQPLTAIMSYNRAAVRLIKKMIPCGSPNYLRPQCCR